MNHQFAPRKARPMRPEHYLRLTGRIQGHLRDVLDRIHGDTPQDRRALTLAIFGLHRTARELMRRHEAQNADTYHMAMLPNEHHPGPRCSCSACLREYLVDARAEPM